MRLLTLCLAWVCLLFLSVHSKGLNCVQLSCAPSACKCRGKCPCPRDSPNGLLGLVRRYTSGATVRDDNGAADFLHSRAPEEDVMTAANTITRHPGSSTNQISTLGATSTLSKRQSCLYPFFCPSGCEGTYGCPKKPPSSHPIIITGDAYPHASDSKGEVAPRQTTTILAARSKSSETDCAGQGDCKLHIKSISQATADRRAIASEFESAHTSNTGLATLSKRDNCPPQCLQCGGDHPCLLAGPLALKRELSLPLSKRGNCPPVCLQCGGSEHCVFSAPLALKRGLALPFSKRELCPPMCVQCGGKEHCVLSAPPLSAPSERDAFGASPSDTAVVVRRQSHFYCYKPQCPPGCAGFNNCPKVEVQTVNVVRRMLPAPAPSKAVADLARRENSPSYCFAPNCGPGCDGHGGCPVVGPTYCSPPNCGPGCAGIGGCAAAPTSHPKGPRWRSWQMFSWRRAIALRRRDAKAIDQQPIKKCKPPSQPLSNCKGACQTRGSCPPESSLVQKRSILMKRDEGETAFPPTLVDLRERASRALRVLRRQLPEVRLGKSKKCPPPKPPNCEGGCEGHCPPGISLALRKRAFSSMLAELNKRASIAFGMLKRQLPEVSLGKGKRCPPPKCEDCQGSCPPKTSLALTKRAFSPTLAELCKRASRAFRVLRRQLPDVTLSKKTGQKSKCGEHHKDLNGCHQKFWLGLLPPGIRVKREERVESEKDTTPLQLAKRDTGMIEALMPLKRQTIDNPNVTKPPEPPHKRLAEAPLPSQDTLKVRRRASNDCEALGGAGGACQTISKRTDMTAIAARSEAVPAVVVPIGGKSEVSESQDGSD